MKAKTKFDRQVSASNARLTDISPKAVDWVYRNLVQHWAFRTPSGETACGECGHKFSHKGKGSFVKCPECGRRLKIRDTLKRKIEESTYFSTLEAVDITVNAAIYILNEYNSLRVRYPHAGLLKTYLRAFRIKIIPILLTVMSTVLGFIPFIIGESKESFWFPLAIGTMSGLVISLIATILLILPLLILPKDHSQHSCSMEQVYRI